MRIAIVCPLGDVNRFGYWRYAEICLTSWRAVGDLFLIHSSRTGLPFNFHAQYIRDEYTLMEVKDDREQFDYRLVALNANRGIEAAREKGYDAVLTICVNWYIEATAGKAIIEACREMLSGGHSYDFLYRRIQIGERIFEADLKSIAVFNLHRIPSHAVRVLVDTLEIDGQKVNSMRGDYSTLNDEAYMDCEFEITPDEFQAKLDDVRNYEDILPKRRGVDKKFWEGYFRQRASVLVESDDPLGPVGQAVFAQRPASTFGDWMLRQRTMA